MSKVIALVDGHAADTIDLFDRGFQYGDGVFETVRVRAGKPLHLGRHLYRLQTSCERLGIDATHRDVLIAEISQLSRQTGEGVVKLSITRGSSARGYRVPDTQTPRRVALAWPDPTTALPPQYRVRLCATRLATQPLLAGIKHMNRLEQVLARREWNDPDIHEGLVMDYHDHLIEGTAGNLFLVRGDVLCTPDLTRCGVAGVMRSVVIDAAGILGIDVVRQDVGVDDLRAAEEVFMCNALTGLRPVVEWVDQARYPAGEITAVLRTEVERLADDDISDKWYSQ